LGMGRRSQSFLKGLAERDDVEVVAGADAWDAARRNAAEVCPGLETFPTPEALFERHKGLDLALVFSRDCDHEAFAEIAFEHGANVFTEKPMATSPEACCRMIAAAACAQKRLMVGFNLRFHPTVLEARRFVDRGVLGKIRAIWEWHEVDLNYFHNWMSVRANSGGLLFQKGSHDFDLFNWFADSEPVKVSAFGGLDRYGGNRPNDRHCPDCEERGTCPEAVNDRHLRFPSGSAQGVPNLEQTKCAFRQEIDVCDNHVVNLLYANGIKGSYTEIHGSPVGQRRFVLLGEQGRFEFEIHTNTLGWRPRDRSQAPTEWQAEQGAGGHGGADSPLLEAIVTAFRDGGEIAVTAEDGLRAVLVSYAGELAIRDQTVVEVGTL